MLMGACQSGIRNFKTAMSTLHRAIEIATQAHQGQFDKSGKDYIGHPLHVMEMGQTKNEKIVGILHDVIEDTDWTFEKLADEGFSQEIIAALRCVTKLSENENYDDFIERVKKNPLATAVKINDLTDNMDAELSRLWSEGTSVADIANHFGRKNSAIITRIKKLGL